MNTFAFLRLKGGEGGWRALHGAFTGALRLGRVRGAFFGLFGVGSNELMAMWRKGLHVLRFFDVNPAHYDEFVELSRTAWETFEVADGYRAEPQGLFRLCDDAAERGLMLLVTWYDGLGSWQASRRPPAAAGQRFQRRGQLATSTVAYATRLIV